MKPNELFLNPMNFSLKRILFKDFYDDDDYIKITLQNFHSMSFLGKSNNFKLKIQSACSRQPSTSKRTLMADFSGNLYIINEYYSSQQTFMRKRVIPVIFSSELVRMAR